MRARWAERRRLSRPFGRRLGRLDRPSRWFLLRARWAERRPVSNRIRESGATYVARCRELPPISRVAVATAGAVALAGSSTATVLVLRPADLDAGELATTNSVAPNLSPMTGPLMAPTLDLPSSTSSTLSVAPPAEPQPQSEPASAAPPRPRAPGPKRSSGRDRDQVRDRGAAPDRKREPSPLPRLQPSSRHRGPPTTKPPTTKPPPTSPPPPDDLNHPGNSGSS